MTIQRFLGALEKMPFVPFRVVLDSGQAIKVHHPDFVMLLPNKEELIVVQPNNDFSLININHVGSLAFMRQDRSK